ncbi:MAG TPA: maleylpyruvate isomerase family mycothiol-dependent enzyme [Streptosporangiaceae bacterium]
MRAATRLTEARDRRQDIEGGIGMKPEQAWKHIHAERADLAETWAGLSARQWAAQSWCQGWSVQDTAGHVLAAAEQTPLNFYKELTSAGFKFSVFTERGARRLAAIGPEELIRRLRARTTTTNHPPAPVTAMLGEIVVHGQDILRPLGLKHQPPQAALVAVADSWKNSNLLIGAKRRIAGLRLQATDAEWAHGDGPEVSGPLLSLILAMTGRKAVHPDLTGEGVAELGRRP